MQKQIKDPSTSISKATFVKFRKNKEQEANQNKTRELSKDLHQIAKNIISNQSTYRTSTMKKNQTQSDPNQNFNNYQNCRRKKKHFKHSNLNYLLLSCELITRPKQFGQKIPWLVLQSKRLELNGKSNRSSKTSKSLINKNNSENSQSPSTKHFQKFKENPKNTTDSKIKYAFSMHLIAIAKNDLEPT